MTERTSDMDRELPDIRLDLHGAYLRRVDLSKARLSGANFAGADFAHANFAESDLADANLSRANLTRASLRGANLENANLKGANLRGADLSDARGLDEVQLAGAILDETTRLPHGVVPAISEVANATEQ